MLVSFLIFISIVFFLYSIWYIVLSYNGFVLYLKDDTFQTLPKSSNSIEDLETAILLTVCDDFVPSVAESLLNQETVLSKLFILDDSSLIQNKKEIDKWVLACKTKPTVVRRSSRKSFKAGNINNWLSLNSKNEKYKYILIADADVELPNDYLLNLQKSILQNEFSFVQGCHIQKQFENWFERVGGLLIDSEWLGFVLARNNWGIPQVLGHGVLIRKDTLEDIGGIPELVSEDLALTIHLAEHSKYGIISSKAIAKESFPPSYQKYKKRLKRWIAADVEILKYYLKRIFVSNIKISAKLDLLLRETRLPFLCVFTSILFGIAIKTAFVGTSKFLVHPIFGLMSILIWISYLPALWVGKYDFLQRLKYLFYMPFISTGLLSEYPFSFIKGITNQVEFNPTNSDIKSKEEKSPIRILFLILFSTALIYSGFMSFLPIFIGVGIAILSSLIFDKGILSNYIVNFLCVIFWIFFIMQWITLNNISGIPIEAIFVLSGLSACRD